MGRKGNLASMVQLGTAQQQGVVAAIHGDSPLSIIWLHGGPIDVPGRLAQWHRLTECAAEARLPTYWHSSVLRGLQDLQAPACRVGRRCGGREHVGRGWPGRGECEHAV